MASSIALQTSKGNDIENYQETRTTLLDQKEGQRLIEKYKSHVTWRTTNINPRYNCHGLTFASRRTGIHPSNLIRKILHDDLYIKISKEGVLPGDIIIYYTRSENSYYINHSGIIVAEPEGIIYLPNSEISESEKITKFPWVVSKWGRFLEVYHRVHQCPYYQEGEIEFFRIK